MKSKASPSRTLRTICGFLNSSWSRREDLNTPSADYNSAALPLSYTSFEDDLQIFDSEVPTLFSQCRTIALSSQDAARSPGRSIGVDKTAIVHPSAGLPPVVEPILLSLCEVPTELQAVL